MWALRLSNSDQVVVVVVVVSDSRRFLAVVIPELGFAGRVKSCSR